jgi:bifunctional UDP-N-acetylglucosamine pyrophosphorylase / glucosamine-1-phosphate N-acetyltransferase
MVQDSSPNLSARPAAVILAAGKGTRMPGDLPKVVHPVGGRAMVCAVVDACREAGCGRIIVVVGYKQELVRQSLADYEGLQFVVQDKQLGTGHAVQTAGPNFAGTGWAHDVFVLCGDGPLVRAATLQELLRRHRESGPSATLATAVLDDPTGYGRIVRDEHGQFRRIVEHKNATEEERQIREVNPSYYCFRETDLFSALSSVEPNAVTGEYYLTDTLALLLAEGKRVEVVAAVPPEDVLSINTPDDLAAVDRIYRARAEAVAREMAGTAADAQSQTEMQP